VSRFYDSGGMPLPSARVIDMLKEDQVIGILDAEQSNPTAVEALFAIAAALNRIADVFEREAAK